MRILVTGGAGFIGSHFIPYILKRHPGYRITNFDKLTYAGNLENLHDIEKHPNYRFVHGDICDPAMVEPLAKEVDIIVNFAAETHVDRSIMNPGGFIQTDVYGTYVLMEAARKYHHNRYIQISTDEVYGSIQEGTFTEDSPLHPSSPYAASKAAADLLVLSYVRTYGFPGGITRSSNNFGPYQYPEKMVPLFVTNVLEGKPIPLYGDGQNVRDWIYVLDNCEAIDLVLHKGKPGEIYNIGGGNELTNLELTRAILRELNKPQSLIHFVTDRPGHDRRYALDCTRIKTLGFTPRHSFDEALRKTVDWYESHPAWWKKVRSGEFQEYYRKRYHRIEPG